MAKFSKPKNTKQTFLRVLSYLNAYKAQLIIIAVCIILSALANIAGTYLLSPFVDEGVLPLIGAENPDFTMFIRILIIMGCVYLTGVIANFIFNRLMVNVSSGVLCKIRKDLFEHMQTLPISYYDKHTHGELMSLYTNDTDTLREMISQGIPQIINSVISVVGVFIMMIVLSPALTLFTVVLIVLMLFVVTSLGKKSGAYFKKRQKSLATVNGYMEEMIEGQNVVKVFCHEDVIAEHFSGINEDLREASAGANMWANILMPIMGNLSYVHFAFTAMAGAYLVSVGATGGALAMIGITFGKLFSFLQYSRRFSMPITQLSQQFNSFLSALAGAERIFGLIDETPEDKGGDVTLVRVERYEDGSLHETQERTHLWAWKRTENGNVTYTELKGDVQLNDVTFSYDGKVDVLKHINLYARPGQKVALVGSTGAGKTTITNLINRFYDISSGSITYDGINLYDISKRDLRKSLATVLQDTHLFTGTVMDNIRYGRLDATDEECIAAAKLANADFFISHLPDGYNTQLIADGANLSQGQRQLLAIARVAVADPPVLIMDEATSSIDTRTEALIEKGMDELMRGRTVFVIAHRLSTVRNADFIAVLEHGQIIESGNHESLLEKKGRYHDLYTGTFELD